MYQQLSELIVRVADLVEAEGRVLRGQVAKLSVGLALRLVGAMVLLVGLVLVMAALWIGVEQHAGAAWASLATGALALAIAGGLFWVAGKAGT
jgi:hypothetical protein